MVAGEEMPTIFSEDMIEEHYTVRYGKKTYIVNNVIEKLEHVDYFLNEMHRAYCRQLIDELEVEKL